MKNNINLIYTTICSYLPHFNQQLQKNPHIAQYWSTPLSINTCFFIHRFYTHTHHIEGLLWPLFAQMHHPQTCFFFHKQNTPGQSIAHLSTPNVFKWYMTPYHPPRHPTDASCAHHLGQIQPLPPAFSLSPPWLNLRDYSTHTACPTDCRACFAKDIVTIWF